MFSSRKRLISPLAALKMRYFFHPKAVSLIFFLPQSLVERINKLNLSMVTKLKLDQAITAVLPFSLTDPNLEKQKPRLNAEQLKRISMNLASTNLSQEYYEDAHRVGQSLNQKLIEGQSKPFIKALFSIDPWRPSALFPLPEVVKAAFSALDSYKTRRIMNNVISEGVFRVGLALARLDTDQDAFKVFTDANPKPLVDFKEKNIDAHFVSGAINQQIGDDIKSSIAVLSGLRSKPISGSSLDQDYLVTHLILVPHFLQGAPIYPGFQMRPLTDGVNDVEVKQLIQCFIDFLSELDRLDQKPNL